MVELIKEHKGIPICIKTDAVVYKSKEQIDFSNHYWTEEIKIYKNEEPQLFITKRGNIFCCR